MKRGRKRKNKSFIVSIVLVILIIIAIILVYKNISINNTTVNEKTKSNKNSVDVNNSKTEKDDTKEESTDKKESNKNETTESVSQKPSSDETTENKNENIRKGGNIKLELIGEEEITISKGSVYKDQGVKATYSDGSDASSEVKINNEVDTSKEGTYIVSYYVGNSVVIRTVNVK